MTLTLYNTLTCKKEPFTTIEQRKEARKNKNFAESDRIRDQLKEQGIILVDQPGGVTTWHRS